MVPRKVLFVLTAALPVLVATFAVVMAGQLLADGIGDAPARAALRGVGVGVLVALAVDLLLLVGALAANQLSEPAGPAEDDSRPNP